MSDPALSWPATALTILDEAAIRRWAFRARSALLDHRDRLDRLNVFPVPDGDTGTNLYLTLSAALESMTESFLRRGSGSIAAETDEFARSTLVSARGNSGVILSQLVRGLADVMTSADSPRGGIDGPALAKALQTASGRARAAVHDPVEGTILTVAEAAAAAASRLELGDALVDVAQRAVDGARSALVRTPSLLPELARAGVVDAGGAGFLVILAALLSVVRGTPDPETDLLDEGLDDGLGIERGDGAADSRSDCGPVSAAGSAYDGPRYEVMFLLRGCTDDDASVLGDQLRDLGDSVLVAGDSTTRSVHVHADTPEDVLSCARRIGGPEQVRIVDLTVSRPAVDIRLEEYADALAEAGISIDPGTPAPRRRGDRLVVPTAAHALAALAVYDPERPPAAQEELLRAAAAVRWARMTPAEIESTLPDLLASEPEIVTVVAASPDYLALAVSTLTALAAPATLVRDGAEPSLVIAIE